ncbi:MAG: hypothetical protein D6732_06690 [Methanobacteriota archaeon]|nr:MAG: hypothetical protein D6732_06690 [Euryarchaeota archaeon]
MNSQNQDNIDKMIAVIRKFVNQRPSEYEDVLISYKKMIEEWGKIIPLSEVFNSSPICSKVDNLGQPFSFMHEATRVQLTVHKEYFDLKISVVPLIAAKVIFLFLMHQTPKSIPEKKETMQETALFIAYYLLDDKIAKRKFWAMWTQVRKASNQSNYVRQIRPFLQDISRIRKDQAIKKLIAIDSKEHRKLRQYPYSAIPFPELKEKWNQVLHLITNHEGKQNEMAILLNISQSRFSQLFRELKLYQIVVPVIEFRPERLGFKQLFMMIVGDGDLESIIVGNFSYLQELISIQVRPDKWLYLIRFIKPLREKMEPLLVKYKGLEDCGELKPKYSFQFDAVGLFKSNDQKLASSCPLKNHFAYSNIVDLSDDEKMVLAQVLKEQTTEIDVIRRVCKKRMKTVSDYLRKFKEEKIVYMRYRTIKRPDYQYQVALIKLDNEMRMEKLQRALKGAIPFVEGHLLKGVKGIYAFIKLGGEARHLIRGQQLIEGELMKKITLHTYHQMNPPKPRISFRGSWIFRYDRFKFLNVI